MLGSNSKAALAAVLLAAVPAFMGIASWGLARGIEPFVTWYYCFAWWSYIALVEAWLHRRGGNSELWRRPKAWFELLPVSIGVWLIFELYNFRLHNWHYLNLPDSTPVRWLGYSLAFATVLPGLFASRRLIDHLGWFTAADCPPLVCSDRILTTLQVLGGLFLAAPLIWPQVAFPWIWLGFILLLEPLNYRMKVPSLLQDLANGAPGRLYQLLAAGLWCGLLWEFWNYWAGSKWVYTLPLFNRPRLFEMPLAGFLGFPPFALECFAMVSTIQALRDRARTRLSRPTRRRLALVIWVLVLLAFLGAFSGIDRFTVRSYHSVF